MKKIVLVMTAILVLSLLPTVYAEGAEIESDAQVVVPEPLPDCLAPEIHMDHTARGWNPNDQTFYTADIYGKIDEGGKYKCGAEYNRYLVEQRQNYAFTGETFDFYVLVEDGNGKGDIETVQLLVDDEPVGRCAEIDLEACDISCGQDGTKIDETAFGIDQWKPSKMKTYVCKLIVQEKWKSQVTVKVQAKDGKITRHCTPVTVKSRQSDYINFNPTLALSLTGGPIDFGTVEAGSTAISNSVFVGNTAETGSGVVMDMYIASDDYFTDPSNPDSICGTGNGIKYDRFSYYATKGSINSGLNNADFEGLGDGDGSSDRQGDTCESNPDEFTTLTSHSGEIEDMCRIINWKEEGSLLNQGAEMSLTFKLNLEGLTKNQCHGSFSDGEFHFVGRVV